MIEDDKPSAQRKKMIWRYLRIALVALVILVPLFVYVSIAMTLHNQAFADSILLCPTIANEKLEMSIPGATKRALKIPTVGREQLDACLFAVPGAKSLTIVNHGNAGNITGRVFVANAFTNAKCNVLLYDYRGYGESTGQATVPGLAEDGDAVYQYAVKKLGYAANKIILYGESIGSTVACQVAAGAPCEALVLYAPLDSIPYAGKSKVAFLNIFPDFCFAYQLDNVSLISKVHAPLLIFHGLDDATLRPAGAQRIFDAANEPKKIVFLPASGHSYLSKEGDALYLNGVPEFVAKLPH